MQLTGQVVDQTTGKPIAGATIWEFLADGRSANVIGYSDSNGRYTVNVVNDNSNVNFSQDGYQGTNISAVQAGNSDQVLLAPDGSFSANITFRNVPTWLWVLAGVGFIYLLNDKKK